MSAPITETNSRLAAQPRLARAVSAGLRSARMPSHRHKQAAMCALYLERHGYLTDESTRYDPGGYVSDAELVKMRKGEAIAELQRVGLLPSSLFGWVLAFAVRWMFEKFIETLIIQWTNN
tara:strand:- start:334 stop:693 length:360 start_codon:yes stop_codon:yes gene_type:complete